MGSITMRLERIERSLAPTEALDVYVWADADPAPAIAAARANNGRADDAPVRITRIRWAGKQ